MDKKPKSLELQHLKNLLLTTLFTLGVLISIALFGLRQVEQETKTNLIKQLDTTLNTNLQILKVWLKDKKLDAEVIASQSALQENIFQLVKLAQNKTSAKTIIASPEHTWLRKHLGSTIKKYEFVGFVVFNLEGQQIGALLDAPIGKNHLKDMSDFFKRSLAGETVVSLPFKGEVDLPDSNGIIRKNWPTMFVSTPIKDDSGTIRAVLAFRLRPETEFSELFRLDRFGNSGESYAFSSEGQLLSDSRFNQELRQMGLIAQEPWSQSILNIHIKDPQVNLAEGVKPSLPEKEWALTKMAASATLGNHSVSSTPYNDYRGVPVIGTWIWLPELNFGITSEIDAQEAFHPLYSLRKSFYTLFGFLSLACVLGIIFRSKQIIAEQKQHQKELNNLDEKLKTQIILDNVVDAIITINESGIVQSFNQGAQKLFRYKDNEVIGQNIKMLMPDPDHSKHDEYLKRYLTTKSPHIIGIGREVTGLKKDGTEFPMDLAISQVNLHDRIIFTGVIRDISQRKEFEAALVEAKQLADEANRSKGDFLANMSHEIRTPMNGIIGLTHLAMRTELTPVQHDYLRKINSSSQNLLTIINDILDVSKIEAGKLEIEKIEFSLDKVLEGVFDVLSAKIQEKGLEFHFNIKDDVPSRLIGDPVRIGQILTNLASNAVKFTKHGQVIISFRVLEKTQDSLNLECSVQDSGIGLSDDHISKLFKPFHQADTSTTREFGGTGLGLTIVKKLVLLMGGDIRIESQLGKGSNFIFNIVLKPSQIKEELKPTPNALQDTRILVIDDSPFMRDILMAMLQSLKFEATITSRFAEGLQELQSTNQPYDLVLIDNKLPDATGAKVCGQIKAINPEKETKTILISGFTEEDILKDIETAEFDGFLHKPITRSTLFNMIQHVLGFQEAKKRVTSASESSEVECRDSIQGARILLVEDNKINQQIACEFLRHAGLVVSVAENGEEALKAVKQNEFDMVLMDIQMPVMDGYRATREIRALTQFKDLPIIAMTANASDDDRKKALDCGMNGHIPKPVDLGKLIKTLVQTISPGTPLPDIPQTKERDKSQWLPPIPGLDLEDGLNRVAHNEDLYKSLLIQFSSHKANVIEEMETAVKQKDMTKAAQLLHSLKGVAGNIGAKEIANKATQIEKKLQNNNLDSEYETLVESAKQSMNILISGIATMAEKHSTNNGIEISQPLPEYDKLSPHFKILADLISENNMTARDYLETIEETFNETPIKDFLSPVKEHLNQFNFSQAAESLEKLINDLQITAK
jgi:PAS domain S-box-containing protein